MIKPITGLLGVALFSSLVGYSIAFSAIAENMGQRATGYSVPSTVLGMGKDDTGNWELYFLTQTNGKWTASKTGDTKNENVEAVRVNVLQKEIRLYAWGTRPRDFSPETHSLDVWVCKGSNERNSVGNNICLSAFGEGFFSARINQEKLLEAAQSSGLIAMAEQDHQAKLDETRKQEQVEVAARQKAEQDKLAANQLAEQGDANAKFQRGIFYLGASRFDVDAERWFEKAAEMGSAAALYKLAVFQNEHHHNEVEAERLLRKAAQGGSVEARVALEDILAERKRVALQEKQAAAQQAKEQQQVVAFRKSISGGDESNCGPIIEVKGKLIKVAVAVANYGNEHWVRRDEIYPSGWECRFVNGQYQPPQ